MAKLLSLVSDWSTELYSDAANLLASDAGDVVSAGCPTELKVRSLPRKLIPTARLINEF